MNDFDIFIYKNHQMAEILYLFIILYEYSELFVIDAMNLNTIFFLIRINNFQIENSISVEQCFQLNVNLISYFLRAIRALQTDHGVTHPLAPLNCAYTSVRSSYS